MPVVTVDFDSTLTIPQFDEESGLFVASNMPNTEMIGLLLVLAQSNEVHIVTSRFFGDRGEIDKFVQSHKLPVKAVHCTNGALKVFKLKELGSIIHFDDDDIELDHIRKAGIKTFLIEVIKNEY